MFTHTKTEVDCSPGASTEKLSKRRKRPRTTRLAKAEGAGEAEEKKQTNQTPPPATAEKNKIKQPHIRLALSRADTP